MVKDNSTLHPRPRVQRTQWIDLNGEWQFEIDKAADGESRGLTYGKDPVSYTHLTLPTICSV